MPKMPVFIKISEYKELIDVLNIIKTKIQDAKVLFAQISELKAKEDEVLSKWTADLENIETKIEDIDRTLFEPEI